MKKTYSKAINHTHLYMPKGELRDLDSLRRKYTVRSKYDDKTAVAIYNETKRYFGFPRHSEGAQKFSKDTLDKTVYPRKIDKFSMKSTLWDYQEPLYRKFLKEIEKGKTGFLLDMLTSTGKTVVLLNFIVYLKTPTLVIVPRELILEQWINRILEHTTLTKNQIGHAQGDICNFEGKAIVVGMIHSLWKNKYSREFKEYFGCIVWDEVDTAGADCFSTTTMLYPARYRLGASATLKRADGTDRIYKEAIGEVTLKTTKGHVYSLLVIEKRYIADSYDHVVDYIDVPIRRRGRLISTLAKDEKRNSLLAEVIYKFYMSDRRTLFLSERIYQIEGIKSVLKEKYNMNSLIVKVITGDIPKDKKKRQPILDNSPIILATFGVFAKAVDVPDLAGLVFGTPVANPEQPSGRILRDAERIMKNIKKKRPVAFDIIDVRYKDTMLWRKMRGYRYSALNAEITQIS